MLRISLLIVFLFLSCSISADERGLKRTTLHATTQAGDSIALYKESHALLVGVSEYTDWPRLDSIPAELDSVEQALQAQDFNVVRLEDPTGVELSAGIENFINDYGYEPDNRLLIYFAGHGYSIGKKGYLLAADVPLPEDEGFRSNILPMSHIMSWARDMESKHVLFLFDSCFSGSVFQSRSLPEDRQRYIRKVTAEPVRQFITAGSADQEVPATSTFTPAFVNAINGEGDLNQDGYITGSELGVHLSQLVPRFTAQTPQYGKIKDYDLSRGDFVFFKQEIHVNLPEEDAAGDSLEAIMWKSAEDGNSIEEYQAYIDQYPDGVFNKMAMARIDRLKKSAEISIKPSVPETGKLTILAQPENARIRIMNIVPRYEAEMKLEMNKGYDVLVSKPGYKSKRRWITLNQLSQTETIKLEKIKAEKITHSGNQKDTNELSQGLTINTFESKSIRECESGDAAVCGKLSYLYREGISVNKNFDKAFSFAQKGCITEQSSPSACAELGYLYLKGIGVTKDLSKAFTIVKQACANLDQNACNSLTYMYRKGLGVEKDERQAFALAKLGCDKGNAQACGELGYMYREGIGVKPNRGQAIAVSKRGCAGGSTDACKNLNFMQR